MSDSDPAMTKALAVSLDTAKVKEGDFLDVMLGSDKLLSTPLVIRQTDINQGFVSVAFTYDADADTIGVNSTAISDELTPFTFVLSDAAGWVSAPVVQVVDVDFEPSVVSVDMSLDGEPQDLVFTDIQRLITGKAVSGNPDYILVTLSDGVNTADLYC